MRKIEAWKYNDIESVFDLPTATDTRASLPVELPEGFKLVFVNGFFHKELSDWDELQSVVDIKNEIDMSIRDEAKAFFPNSELFSSIKNKPLKQSSFKADPVSSYNAEHSHNQFYIRIKENTNIAKLVLVNLQTGGLTNHFIQIELEKNSTANILHYSGSLDEMTGGNVTGLRMSLADNAVCDYAILQNMNEHHLSILQHNVELSKNAKLNSLVSQLSGKTSRVTINALLAGENAEVQLHGCYLPAQNHTLDQHYCVTHNAPNTASKQFVRGVANDKGHAIFNGKATILPGAINSIAMQKNNNIALSNAAVIDAKPELEIYCDQVQCAHGATIGEIDEEALFYLQARGLSHEQAMHLLIGGFVQSVFDRSANTLKDYLQEITMKTLEDQYA